MSYIRDVGMECWFHDCNLRHILTSAAASMSIKISCTVVCLPAVPKITVKKTYHFSSMLSVDYQPIIGVNFCLWRT